MKEQPFQPDLNKTSGLPQPAPTSTNLQLMSLEVLLRLCLQYGSEILWAEFIRRSQPLIATVVLRSVRRWMRPSPSAVDDLVQDTFLKLCANDFKALREFHCSHERELYGFLKVVAANVVHDHFRGHYSKKRGCGCANEDLDLVIPIDADSDSTATRMERKVLIREIADCLEMRAAGPNFARDYAIFWLYYSQGYSANAIAQLPSIGLSVKGVESTILRLTRLVREGLNGKPSDSDDGD